MTQFDSIAHVPTLTDAQRAQARDAARRALLARYARLPARREFADFTTSQYPRWFSALVGIALVIIALAAGTISGIRLYFAGKDYAAQTITTWELTVVIGAATFLAAELLVILATVAGQVYLRGWRQSLSAIPVGVGMAVAFVGNWTMTQPSTNWGYVETFFPPIAVLSVAFFFEVALIPEVERRQANEVAYQTARAAYEALVSDPDQHPRWRDTQGWALWDLWRQTAGAGLDPDAIPQAERRLIVRREMSFDRFFDDDAHEFSLNALHSRRASGASQMDIALQFLADHPELFDALQMNAVGQSELAGRIGVSQSTLSRALHRKLERNGHGD